MKHLALGCGLAMVTALTLALGSAPARADFFSLDGRFQCLDRANAVCGDPQPLVSMQPAAPPARPAPLPVPPPAGPVATAVPPEPATHVAPPVPRPDDPLHDIAQRVQAYRPASADIAWLKHAAQSGNARAIELLAWCNLNAIGTPRDAVKAYLLYGAAADAALPHARENQALVYEQDLSPVQRQQVLDLVNEGVALAQLSPAAP